MKTLFISFILSLCVAAPASAKLFDLDQASNLMQILDDVYDASLDTNNYFDITEIFDDIKPSDYNCSRISNEEVYNRLRKSFVILSEVYPDEIFPIKDAEAELQLILGSSPYYHCPLAVDEGFEDIQFNDLYISMGSGISFVLESSRF